MKKIHVNRTGTTLGQFTTAEVDAGLKSGQFLHTDLGWREGMPEWKPLGQWADFDPAPVMEGLPLAGAAVPAAEPERDGPDWEHRKRLGFMNALFGTIKACLLNPMEMFVRMRTTGGLKQPLYYYVLLAYVGALVALGFQMVLQIGAAGMNGDRTGMMVAGGTLLGYAILMPVVLVIGLYFYAWILQLSLWVLGEGGTPYETIFRVAAYATGSTSILSVVPFCGGFAGTVWGIVLVVIGLTKVRSISTGKAVAAVLLPVAVFCAVGVAFVGMMIGFSGDWR